MQPDGRVRRVRVATALAADQGGVVHRAALRAHGISRHDVRTEVAAGRWRPLGMHTLRVLAVEEAPVGRLWTAVWETGWGAVLDGAAALVAQGMTGFAPAALDIAVPRGARIRRPDGVTVHRRREVGPVMGSGVPRTRPEHALIRAAQWARSDRQAALLVCLPVQQRLVRPAAVLAAWSQVQRSPRRSLLGAVIGDVCDGAHSLGEIDFSRWCRRRALPPPQRQEVRILPSGRVYLDAAWEGLVVEVDGAHHHAGLMPVDDALRANEVVIEGTPVLRLPVLGLRLQPEAFMDQVARAVTRYVLSGARHTPRPA